MTDTPPEVNISLAEVAAESAEESVQKEREIVGDDPDTGDVVPPDNAQ